MTCAKLGRACVSGAPRSAPSHRCVAVTYGPGQRNQPCKTCHVLHGDDAMIAARGRSKLKSLHLTRRWGWRAPLSGGTPARKRAPAQGISPAGQADRTHPLGVPPTTPKTRATLRVAARQGAVRLVCLAVRQDTRSLSLQAEQPFCVRLCARG